jgi:hypothetical protein
MTPADADAWAAALDPFAGSGDAPEPGGGDGTSEAADLAVVDPVVVGRVRSALAAAATWEAPPAAVRDRLLAAVRAESAGGDGRDTGEGGDTGDGDDRGGRAGRGDRAQAGVPIVEGGVVVPLRRSRRARWLAAGGGFLAGAAAAAAVAAVIAYQPTDGQTVELAAPGRPDAVVTADVDPQSAGVAITLHITGLPPAPDGTYYAAWLSGPQGVVPIGSFHWRKGGIPIELWSGVTPDRYPRLYVTLQQEDQALTPSDDVVLDGTVPAAP